MDGILGQEAKVIDYSVGASSSPQTDNGPYTGLSLGRLAFYGMDIAGIYRTSICCEMARTRLRECARKGKGVNVSAYALTFAKASTSEVLQLFIFAPFRGGSYMKRI